MMRSLYSGVSGLRVHQTKMDVIGNNISNVNTVGFKASTVTFTDILYQTTQSASGPNATTGAAGQNAMQIGLGATMGSITAAMSKSGGAQRTDNALDVMIEGDGFFVVNSGGSNYFTKAGSFTTDANGTLCTTTGATVMGWQVDKNDSTKVAQGEVKALQIMSAENMYSSPEATTKAYITGNIDNMDTQLSSDTGKMVSIDFYDKMGHAYTAQFKFTKNADSDSNNEFICSLSDIKDESGQSIFINKIINEEDNTVTYEQSAYGGGGISLGGSDYSIEEADDFETSGEFTLSGEGIGVVFDGATGKFAYVGEEGERTSIFAIDADPNPFEEVTIDFSTITMYSTSGKSTLEGQKGGLDGTGRGKQVGNMTGLSIDNEGKIFGKYDNGDNNLLGQIVVATFANPAGLEAVGNSLFQATQNSGDFDGIGESVSASGGSFSTGVLEMSNVDLSAEFTDMITTQRGFQANSRIITTSDTLLEELINLKR